MFDRWTKKVWGWYAGLPWWGKVLGAVVLLLVLVLGVLAAVAGLVGPRPGGDAAATRAGHAAVVDAAVQPLVEANARADAVIAERKAEVATRLVAATRTDVATAKNRARLEQATTMEELDALQKELGL
jgi:hypothetical protein